MHIVNLAGGGDKCRCNASAKVTMTRGTISAELLLGRDLIIVALNPLASCFSRVCPQYCEWVE